MQDYLARVSQLSLLDQQQILGLINRLDAATAREKARGDFLTFVRGQWPGFIDGKHLKVMADLFRRIAAGEVKRATISMPPRLGKSKFASVMLPAWYMGKFPDRKIICASHTVDLAKDFGREVRNIVASEDYQKVFPGVMLQTDSKAAGRWNINKGGAYYAVGVGGAIAGRGADLFIIDDPVDEQLAMTGTLDPKIYDGIYDWYVTGPRQRLQPGGCILIIATRWNKRDLIGQVLQTSIERELEEWEVIEFPAVLEADEEKGLPERSLWPEYWPLELFQALRAELPPWRWNAQYLQKPTSEGAAILKRDWWKEWLDKDGNIAKPPECEFIIATMDTANTKSSRADYTAMTVFGVFEKDSDNGEPTKNIILLDAWKDRLEFPDLKSRVMEEYKFWKPDSFVIESKASGTSLIQELRQMGIPVQDFTPTRGTKGKPNDKIARANSVSDILKSGLVWYPPKKFADDVIEECAEFPVGAHDDWVDCVIMALRRFRDGGFIRLPSDEDEDNLPVVKKVEYY